MAVVLDSRRVFYVACVEVYRDGVVDPAENALLRRLMEVLSLSPADARVLAQGAVVAVGKEGQKDGALDPARVMRVLERLAAADGVVTEEEQGLLDRVAELLGYRAPQAAAVPEPAAAPEPIRFLDSAGERGEPASQPACEPACDPGDGPAEEHAGETQVRDSILDVPFFGSVSMIQLLGGLGSLLIGLGVLFLIAANWSFLPPWVRIGLVELLILVVYGLAFEVLIRPDRAPSVGRSMVFLGCLLYGGSIWQVGQTFHQGAHWPDGLLIWALGMVPLAYVMRSANLVGLAMLLLMAWNLAEQFRPHEALPWLPFFIPGSFRTFNLAFPPLFLAVSLPAIRRFPASGLGGLAALGLASWSVIPLWSLDHDVWAALGHAMVPGMVLALAVSRMLRGEQRDPEAWQGGTEWLASRTLLFYGALLALTPYEHSLTASLLRIAALGERLCLFPVLLGSLGLAAAVVDWRRHQELRARVVARTLVILAAAALGPPVIAALGGGRSPVHVAYQVLCVSITFGAVYTAVVIESPWLLWAGFLPLLGWVGWTLLSWINSLKSTGLSLIGGGLLILAGAFSLERLRRQVAGWEPPPPTEEGGQP